MSKFKDLINNQKNSKSDKKHRFNLEAITISNRDLTACPCGSSKSFSSCCEPIHKDIFKAKTPEMLMRSRYSAFTIANIDYLLSSHHSSTRPTKEANEIKEWATNVKWIKLEVLETNIIDNTEGFVTFKAHFSENNKSEVIFEKSRFVKENNHWTYIDGLHNS
ncbi:YchJ family metal-binding protein [Flavobacteriaceae bacterium]|nr:YchJ family metal-binding protein [Flavobacteriaceae bacterium]